MFDILVRVNKHDAMMVLASLGAGAVCLLIGVLTRRAGK